MCARRWRREEVTGSECDALDGRLRGNSRNQLSESVPRPAIPSGARESPPPPLSAHLRVLCSRARTSCIVRAPPTTPIHRWSRSDSWDGRGVELYAEGCEARLLLGPRPRVKGGSARPSCARSRGARASRAEARCGDRRSAKFARSMYVLCFHRSLIARDS